EALQLAKTHPNIALRLASTFTGFMQDGDGVTAQLTNAAGQSESVRGAYLVGAEGAHSIERKELDIDFEGFTYPDRTLNVEVAYVFRKYGYPEPNSTSDPADGSTFSHGKGPPARWRIHFPAEAEAEEVALTQPEALQARLQNFLPTGQPFDIVASRLYVVHQ